jgi:hypothetical protein
MAGSPPPAAREQGADPACCPGCGSGDLFTIRIARRDGGEWRGVYCAGQYDRGRRRFVRRSCGFSGSILEAGARSGRDDDRVVAAAG